MLVDGFRGPVTLHHRAVRVHFGDEIIRVRIVVDGQFQRAKAKGLSHLQAAFEHGSDGGTRHRLAVDVRLVGSGVHVKEDDVRVRGFGHLEKGAVGVQLTVKANREEM